MPAPLAASPVPQAPILTVTLNPCLDLAASVAGMQPGPKLRLTEPSLDPGGGGINVARAVHILGGQATAFVAAGGATGARVLALLAAEGVPTAPFPGPGETRQSLAVTDRATGGQYRLMLPGPQWRLTDRRAVLAAIAALAVPGGFVVLSGSQPPGLPDDFAAALARRLARAKARLVLDTSGPALAAAIRATRPVEVLRMDQEEAAEVAGHPLASRRDTADFAQSLVRAGAAHMAIVARGADGSTLATATARLHASGVDVPVASAVGAGDSFLAAFVLALARDLPAAEALRHGSAAAAAAVMTEATALCTRRDAERLRKRVVLSEV
ncbi:1-phosphofructokinase family hexose kinase [Frigidibacter oleivorans]|uniref:1-phosphofructokinase family hexose kinase n=1 Tax=Frigidibacter oleivorans TaxID=2487129 RepID=UPI0022A78128|nr:1-phosphofructokinase family hexose kinase [Frigidibacter oleivorans]